MPLTRKWSNLYAKTEALSTLRWINACNEIILWVSHFQTWFPLSDHWPGTFAQAAAFCNQTSVAGKEICPYAGRKFVVFSGVGQFFMRYLGNCSIELRCCRKFVNLLISVWWILNGICRVFQTIFDEVLLQIDLPIFFLPMHSVVTINKIGFNKQFNTMRSCPDRFPFAIVQILSLSVNIDILAMITNCEVV